MGEWLNWNQPGWEHGRIGLWIRWVPIQQFVDLKQYQDVTIYQFIKQPTYQLTKLHMFQVSNLSMLYGNMGAKV